MSLFNLHGFVNVRDVEKTIRILSDNELEDIAQLQAHVRDVRNARHNLSVAYNTNESGHIRLSREKTLESRERGLAQQLGAVIHMIESKLG